MILVQIPTDNRFVMRDPVPKLSQAVKSPLHFPAWVTRKRSVQSRTPKRPVVVRLTTAVDPSPAAHEPNPESQRHRCHEPIRVRSARAATEDTRHAVMCVVVETGGRVHVPLAAISFRKSGVHGVSQGDLKGLQRSMERGPQLSVSRIELQGGPVIATGRVQVGLHSLRRESPCQRMKGVDIRHRTNNLHVRNPPGPPLLSACARGLCLYGL